jgi:type IV pilus assembly protein PilX
MQRHSHHGQRGSTLVISLMFLMMLSLLVTGVWRMTMQQESMTGNERDYQIAFEAAERTLRDAELDYFNACMKDQTGNDVVCARRSIPIEGLTGFGKLGQTVNQDNGTCSTDGLCSAKAQTSPDFKIYDSQPKIAVLEGNVSDEKSIVIGTYTQPSASVGSVVPGVSKQPRYVIEALQLGGNNGKKLAVVYRITAIGYGRRADTKVILQSYLDPN